MPVGPGVVESKTGPFGAAIDFDEIDIRLVAESTSQTSEITATRIDIAAKHSDVADQFPSDKYWIINVNEDVLISQVSLLNQDIEAYYEDTGCEKDYTDGLSMSFDEFRFNVRKSNTEPVLRLNVESRGNRTLMEAKTKELLQLIDGQS